MPRTISSSVRPARAAVLVDVDDPDWMETCLRVIEWSTSFWGGWYLCLVPTNGDEIEECFWSLLKYFDPDLIYAYGKTGRDLEIARPDVFKSCVAAEVQAFTRNNPGSDNPLTRQSIEELVRRNTRDSFTISPDLSEELIRRVNPFHSRFDREPHQIVARPPDVSYPLTDLTHVTRRLAEPLSVTTVELDVSTPIELLVHAMAGKVWPELAEKLKRANVEFMAGDQYVESFGALLPPLWKTAQFAFALPLANCGVYHQIGKDPAREPALVVIGDTIRDFCLYYTLSRLRGRTFWLPKKLFDAHSARENGRECDHTEYRPGEEEVFTHLAIFLSENTRQNNLLFTSLSLEDDDLVVVAQTLENLTAEFRVTETGFAVEIVHEVERLVPSVLRLYERDNVARRYRDQFHDGTSVNFIDTPRPKHLTSVPPYDLFWITDVQIDDYRLPRKAEFGPQTIVQPNYGTNEVRVTSEGFAYFCPYIAYFGGDIDSNLVKPRIHLMEPLEVFERIFSEAGLHIQYSDKGNYHLECARKFGSISELAAFWRDDTNRRLLDMYHYRGQSATGKGDKVGDRRYLDFTAFERVVEQADRVKQQIADGLAQLLADLHESDKAKREAEISQRFVEEAAAGQIESLHSIGVLHRGFVFKCEACRQLGWYAVDDLTEQFRCLRCRTVQRYTKKHWIMPHEPSWFYQLDEILFEAHHNDGHIPTLTLDVLRRSAKDSFFYVPECELLKQRGAKKQEMELDFCCCVDGQVFIGEAKKADRLETKPDDEQTVLRKYAHVADHIRADGVVLSTFADSWSERTIANASAILGEQRVRFYAKPDLLSPNLKD